MHNTSAPMVTKTSAVLQVAYMSLERRLFQQADAFCDVAVIGENENPEHIEYEVFQLLIVDR